MLWLYCTPVVLETVSPPPHDSLRPCNQTMYIYNVTMMRVHVTNVPVEKLLVYIFCVCVFSLRYPARNAHAPYCHLWPVQLYQIFPQYLINKTIFRKKKSY